MEDFTKHQSQLIANFFFGVGTMLIFGMVTTMLTEFMPRRASSGVAINNFVRNIFSCVGAITADPLIGAIGNGWLFTGVGIIALASGSVVWAMRKYGPRYVDSAVTHSPLWRSSLRRDRVDGEKAWMLIWIRESCQADQISKSHYVLPGRSRCHMYYSFYIVVHVIHLVRGPLFNPYWAPEPQD